METPKALPTEVLDNIYDGAYFVEPDRRIAYWNKSAERITGYKAEEVVGKYCWNNILRHVDEEGNQLCFIECPLAATIKDGEQRAAEVYLRHKSGYRLPVSVRCSQLTDENGKVIGGLEMFTDNSPKKEIEDENLRLIELTELDPLTEISNRRGMEKAIKARLSELHRYHRRFGVVFADIDRFKQINDRYGHQIGDAILKVIAATLRNNIRGGESVCRWGGEEFVILVSLGKRKDTALYTVSERLRLLVKNSGVRMDGAWIGVTLSLGATMAQEDDNEKSLIERADKLMYTSKTKGRDRSITDALAA
jgi:diguanylate cyclase (GGDEF)-like protein/PAS domain S-box-containing protein